MDVLALAWVWKSEPNPGPLPITTLPSGEVYAKWLFFLIGIYLLWRIVRWAIKRA